MNNLFSCRFFSMNNMFFGYLFVEQFPFFVSISVLSNETFSDLAHFL